jgi:iron-sulfur cluster assembly accessory protein
MLPSPWSPELTNEAAAAMRAIAGEDHPIIQVRVIGSGCCGHRYGLRLIQDIDPGCSICESSGVRLVVDAANRSLCDAIRIELVETADGVGFAITDRAAPACSCTSHTPAPEGS